jgi:hypothetical protein
METNSPFNVFYERLRERNSRAEASLEEDLAARRKTGMKNIQLEGSKLDTYLRHLERVYSQIVAENNPFTREQILDVYKPETIVGLIDSSINYLGTELGNENTGDLYVNNFYKLGELHKLRNLRTNHPQELDGLLDDAEIYEAVALGFVQVSPEQFGKINDEVESAKNFLANYKTSSVRNKIKNCREASRQREVLNLNREICLDYFLTPLGRAAVVPISREIVVFAESDGFFA